MFGCKKSFSDDINVDRLFLFAKELLLSENSIPLFDVSYCSERDLYLDNKTKFAMKSYKKVL